MEEKNLEFKKMIAFRINRLKKLAKGEQETVFEQREIEGNLFNFNSEGKQVNDEGEELPF